MLYLLCGLVWGMVFSISCFLNELIQTPFNGINVLITLLVSAVVTAIMISILHRGF